MLLLDEGMVESDPSDGNSDPLPVCQTISTSQPQHSIPKTPLKIKSKAFPDLLTCPSIWAFLHECILSLKKERWQTSPSNLT